MNLLEGPYNFDNIKELLKYDLSCYCKSKDTDKNGTKYFDNNVRKNLMFLSGLKKGQTQKVSYSGETRQYASRSIQNLPQPIRDIILEKSEYIDYDMKNCHPNILRNLCDLHNIQCPILTEYCNDRNKFLTEVGKKKKGMLVFINTDTPKLKKSAPQKLKDFKKEIQRFRAKLLSIYTDITTDNEDNILSSKLNKVVCDIENKIIDSVIKHYNIKNGIKMFDGIMCKQTIDLDELKRFTGYEWDIKEPIIEWKKKPIKESTKITIDFMEDFYQKVKEDYIINKYENDNQIYHFNKKTGFWNKTSLEEVSAHIKLYMPTLIQSEEYVDKYENCDLGDITKILHKFTNCNSTLRNNASVFKMILINNYIENVEFDEIPHLFHFKNKTLDLSNLELRPRKREDLATMSAIYLEEEETDKLKVIDELVKSIFPQKDVRDNYLRILCNAFSGKPLEKIIFANGEGGNGKGVINGLMFKALGDYSYRGQTNDLCSKSGSGSANPSIANMGYKRFVVFTEPDEREKLLFSTIKEITGDDAINCRKLYSSNTRCVMSGVKTIECNKKPKIDGDTGASMSRRIVDIHFSQIFKTKDDPFRYEGDNYQDANPKYKDPKWVNDNLSSFIRYLLNFMEENKINFGNLHELNLCKSVLDRSKEYIESNNKLLEIFKEFCEPYDGLVSLKDIHDKIKESEYWENFTKRERKEVYAKGKFVTAVKNDPQLKPFYHDKKYYKGVQMKTCLKGWRLKPEPVSNCEIETDED